MNEPLEGMYFNWLYSQVSDPTARPLTQRYTKLLDIFYHTEFVPLVLGDDSRVEDGQDLRAEFLRERGLTEVGKLPSEGCSVLEMLIAFSRRAAFITDHGPQQWFWVMLHNLGLEGVSDATSPSPQAIQNVLDTFLSRTYTSKGFGGLFPMHHTQNDQRGIEIWYQFHEYLLEHNY